MIKELKSFLDKYKKISKNSEYVSVNKVINDLYYLVREARLKRLPKERR